MHREKVYLASLGLLLVLSAVAQADLIPIVNPNFDDSGPVWTGNTASFDTVPGWSSALFSPAYGNVGVRQFDDLPPSGDNNAYINTNAYAGIFYQMLGVTIMEGTYTLTFESSGAVDGTEVFGAYLFGDNYNWHGNIHHIGELQGQATNWGYDQWYNTVPDTLVVTISAGNPHIGEELGIKFTKISGGEIQIDSISLTGPVPPNPEPATVALLCFGGLILMRRRYRNKTAWF